MLCECWQITADVDEYRSVSWLMCDSVMLSLCTVTNLNLGRLQYRDITDDPDARVERVTGLNPNTTYRVYLRAATSVGTGEPIFVDATTELSGRECHV